MTQKKKGRKKKEEKKEKRKKGKRKTEEEKACICNIYMQYLIKEEEKRKQKELSADITEGNNKKRSLGVGEFV